MVEPHDVTVQWVGAVGSTTAIAREGGYAHGDVIATTEQTAGRGRQGRTWIMNPGDGVAMTLVLERAVLGNPTHITRIPLLAASALAEVIGAARPTIKWPNDVLIDGAKVAGILVEDLGDGRLGVGIGVNLSGSPGDGDGITPTHLAAAGLEMSPADLVERVAESVIGTLADVDAPATLTKLERSLGTLGREVLVELPDGRSFTGVAVGLGESGALLVESEGFVIELVAGDVTHLRHAD